MKYGLEAFLEEVNDVHNGDFEVLKDSNQLDYVVIKDFEVPTGRFCKRIIDLAIPVPPDYPRSVGSSIHIRCVPQLLEKTDSQPGVRNITDSKLGSEWRYWSFRFVPSEKNHLSELFHQINAVFKFI